MPFSSVSIQSICASTNWCCGCCSRHLLFSYGMCAHKELVIAHVQAATPA